MKLKPGTKISPSGLVVLAKDGRTGKIVRKINKMCTWCGVSIPKESRKKTWCSKKCVFDFKCTQPAVLRQLVEERDNGVCAICKVDTYTLREAMMEVATETGTESVTPWLEEQGKPTTDAAVYDILYRRRSCWDMDHIVPVHKAGDLFDMRNLRTLCSFCHKDETAKQAADRAKTRKQKKA